MARLWEILLRRPPMVAPDELIGQPGLTFGFAVQSEIEGWLIEGYGPDGRRLGRPLKGLSDPAQATLLRLTERAQSNSELQRLGAAWIEACKHNATNAGVLIAFSDAAGTILADGPPER